MRLVLIGLIGLVVLVVGAALVVPGFVDWTSYKGQIAARAERLTGRAMTIDGDIRFRIVPVPMLSVGNARLANLPGAATPDMASVKEVRVRAAFWPLLVGRLDIEDIVLVAPVIELETLADGQVNWRLGQTKHGDEAAIPAPATTPTPTPTPAPTTERFRFDHATVQDGTIRYRGHGGVLGFEHVNAAISAHGASGPFTAVGDLVLDGVPAQIDGRIAALGEAPAPVNLQLAFPGTGAKARFAGALAGIPKRPVLTGALRAEGNSLADLVSHVSAQSGGSPTLPGFIGQEFELDGTLRAAAGAFEVSEISARLGETRATGSASLALTTPPRANVAVSLDRVDLDGWLNMPARARIASSIVPQKGEAPAPVPEQPAAEQPATQPQPKLSPGFRLPNNIEGNFEAAVDAIVYRGGAIRQARVNAALEQGDLILNQVSAQLPGGGDVSLFGTLSGKTGGGPLFDGSVEARADNLRSVLDWFKIDLTRVAPERLRNFALTGKLRGTPARLDLTGVDLRFDSAHVTGTGNASLGERTKLGMELALDHLNLDDYIGTPAEAKPEADPSAPAAKDGKDSEKKAPMAAPVNPDTAAPAAPVAEKAQPLLADQGWLNDFDAEVKLRSDEMILHGVPMRGVSFAAALTDGNLAIREAMVRDAAGGGAWLSGGLSGFGSDPVIHKIGFEARAEDPDAFFRLLGTTPPAAPERLGRVMVKGQADGAISDLALDGQAEAAGANLRAIGKLAVTDSPNLDMELNATSADLARFLKAFRLQTASANLGSLGVKARLTASKGNVTLANIGGKIGPVTVSGGASASLDGLLRPKITADLKTGDIPLDLFLGSVAHAKGEGGGGDVPKHAPAASGKAAAPAAQPAPTPAPAVAGNRWSRELIDLSILRAFDADIHLAADGITRDRLHLDKPDVTLTLVDGVLDVSHFTGGLFKGALSASGRLVAGPAPIAKASISLRDADMRDALVSTADLKVLDGKMNVDAELEATGRSRFDMVSNLKGTATLAGRDGAVQGIDLDAVSARLRKPGADIVSMVQAAGGGETRFSALGGHFKIEKGVVHTEDLHIIARSGEGKGTAVVDLVRWLIDLKTDLSLRDFPDAPPLGFRVEGPLDSPRKFVDINRLQGYLVQKGGAKLLNKMLKNAPSGDSATGEEPAVKAKDALKGLLKKFKKKE